MIITVVLEQSDFDSMHDVVSEVMENDPSNEEIQKLWNVMPDHIKGMAFQWGCNDTVFRDKMYTWLEESKKSN